MSSGTKSEHQGGKLKKYTEIGVNIALALAAMLFIGILGKRYVWEKVYPTSPQGIRQGSRIDLPSIDWSKSDQTLLLGVSTTCHYCSESAPFYQKLVREVADNRNTRIMAYLPQSVAEGQKYLGDLKVPINEIYQGQLSSIGVSGTPTLILVNNKGIVKNVWLGKLPPEQEADVLTKTKLESNSLASNRVDASADRIDVPTLKRLMEGSASIVVVDLDDRTAYKAGHVTGARNIPIDEIEARLGDELSPSDKIILYCRCSNDDVGQIAAKILSKQGYSNLSVLKGGYKEWQKSLSAAVVPGVNASSK